MSKKTIRSDSKIFRPITVQLPEQKPKLDVPKIVVSRGDKTVRGS